MSPDFWLIKKENGGFNILYKLQLHSMQIFFKMATSNFLRWQPPPDPHPLTAYPT